MLMLLLKNKIILFVNTNMFLYLISYQVINMVEGVSADEREKEMKKMRGSKWQKAWRGVDSLMKISEGK